MNSLLYLSLIKIKGTIRSYFSKVSVGIFTMLGVIFYGFLFWKLAFNTEKSATSNIGFNLSILIGIGFLGLILISTFLSKRKALVIETDAFYLFTGPFKRKDIMLFILRNNLVQSFMFSLLVVFVSSMFSRGSYNLFLVIILVITYAIMLFIGLALVDYLYILAISNDKYKDSNKLVGVVLLSIIGIITLYGAYLKGFNFGELGLFIVKGDLFNYIPLLGWTNLLLTSIYSSNTLGIIIGSILLIGSLITIVLLFINFKGDFYEKAMIDSGELTALVNNKDGDQLSLNQDIKTKATSDFRYGAGALFSRNMLELRKTNSFITKGDILLLIVYFILCWFIGLGHMFYMYMVMIWIFQLISKSNLTKDLKNFQVYLIPEKGYKKLFAMILPMLIKFSLLIFIAMVFSGLIYGETVFSIISSFLALVGVSCSLIAGTIISLKVLKADANAMIVSMFRLLVGIGILVLSIIISAIVFKIIGVQKSIEEIVVIVEMMVSLSCILSLVISIFACSSMMNGREIETK